MRTPRPYRPKVLPGRVTPEQVINLSERDDVEEHQQRLRHEQQDVQKRIARLVAAIENGDDAAPLVAKVRELEARQKTLETEVASLRPGPRLAPAVIADRLAEWRRLLRQSPTQGRTVLQRIVHGRLTFTPRTNVITGEVDGYDFGGQTRFDKCSRASPLSGLLHRPGYPRKRRHRPRG